MSTRLISAATARVIREEWNRARQRLEGMEKKERVRCCRFCGCTEYAACVVAVDPLHGTPIGCSWADKEKTVCSAPRCVRKWQEEQRRKGAAHA